MQKNDEKFGSGKRKEMRENRGKNQGIELEMVHILDGMKIRKQNEKNRRKEMNHICHLRRLRRGGKFYVRIV